ncbi:MAG: M23 family metallopeptidase [Gammaproteobacteria bacterium]|nr:M23 family metallopeptidase [Gammaproteobacteria bacterium]
MLNNLIVIFVSMALSGCFSDESKKPVIIIDKSSGQENINLVPINIQTGRPAAKKIRKKTIKKTTTDKKIQKKATTKKTQFIPVTGEIINSFSKKHQGLTFNTSSGQVVRAIRDGVVVYSGNKMKSHGKMIIIKHPLGFYSSYTQNQTLKVVSGDKVKKGQVVALTGKNNFYFEMKKFETPINPLNYLK